MEKWIRFLHTTLSAPNIRPIKITRTDIEHKNNISNSLEFHVSFVMKTKPAPNWSDGPSKCYFILKDRKTIVAVRPSTCLQHASALVLLGHAENTDRSAFSFNMFSIHPGQDLPEYAPAVLLPAGPYFLWQRQSSRVARSVSRMVRKTT